jgi:hypothetical protein
MVKCEFFDLDCPYSLSLQKFGEPAEEFMCTGDSTQCFHWRHPKAGVVRGHKVVKPKEDRKQKVRHIELEDDENV